MKKTLSFFIATFLLVSFQLSNGLIKTENFPQKSDMKVNQSCEVDFTWQGMGPFGQVDVHVTKGNPPFKIYGAGSLLYSGSQRFVTVQFSCSIGGSIQVEANTPCGRRSKYDIVPAGCASL